MARPVGEQMAWYLAAMEAARNGEERGLAARAPDLYSWDRYGCAARP